LHKKKFKKAYDNIILLHYKDKFVEFMKDCNCDYSRYIPETYDLDDIKYPCLMKPKDGYGGGKIKILKNQEMYDEIRDSNNYIFQEIIYYKYTSVAHILCKNGKIIEHIVYTILTPYHGYVKRGSIVNYTSRYFNDVELDLFKKILEKIEYTGLCCGDFSHDDNNNIKIFEINPRIGGSLVRNVDDFCKFMNMSVSCGCYLTDDDR
jgi:carbamoylphosphate synthase large subunit